jgi:hypothetical protein
VIAPPREHEQLVAAGIQPRVHGLYVWRRSAMIIALPILLFSAVLSFIQAADLPDFSTDFGNLIAFLPSVGLLFAPLGAMIVIKSWTNLPGSSKALLVCWSISIAIPVFCALVPFDFIFDKGAAQIAKGYLNQTFNYWLLTQRGNQASFASSLLLPVILSVPAGVLMGAGRIKSLFPAAAMPGGSSSPSGRSTRCSRSSCSWRCCRSPATSC